jgi:uncharacterized repeat protein (TIGR01451 family)
MNFPQIPQKLNKKAKFSKSLQHILLFFIRYISLKNISSRQSLRFISILSGFLLLILFKPTAAGAVSVQLDGTRSVVSGTDCGVATYRFGSNTLYTGPGYTNQAIDLLVEVLPGEDNDQASNCIIFAGNSITVDMVDADTADNFAFMDLKVTVVKKGTTTPVEVDRLAVSGFDLDSTTGTGTDDVYFQNPDGTYITAGSDVTASTGSFFGQYQTKLKGKSNGNCNDSPAIGGTIDVKCRGAATFVNGANGPNTVSSVTLRVQNDNASGTRRFQLSFDFSYIDQLILNTQDYGDATNSYGAAGATISTARSLGYGILPDSETNNQFSATANGDDIDGSTTPGKFDDEDAVRANNLSLDNQTFFTNTTTNLNVTTFGPGYLSAWLDLNKDGDFLDAGEKVLSDLQITNPSILTSTVPLNISSTATAGNTAMRFRFSAATGASETGLTSTGEVEDYQIAIARYDYGDAPSSFGDASHDVPVTPNVYLGNVQPDKELATLLGNDSGAAAAGDDGNGTPDDEDAFTTLANVFTVGNYNLTVPVSNTSGGAATLHAWIDFNKDGKFESGEYKSVAVANAATSANLSWAVPSGITPGNTYVRFRLTTTALTDNTTTANQDERSIGAANDGEVEDYKIAIASNGNPDLPPDFCQGSASSRTLLFILDDSSSVIASEVQQQRDAVMATLNSFVAKGLTGQAAIVGFDANQRTVINYTDITATNLLAFQTALNTNYGVDGSGTNWEAGFQAGTALTTNQPDAVFFFTDGVQTSGGSPEDEATQFKLAGAHIYGIGIELTIDDGFRPITDGNNSISYNGSNILEADYIDIDSYSSLQTQYTNDFLANLCSADFGDAPDTYGTDYIANNNGSNPLGANHRIVSGLYLGATAPDRESNGFVDGTADNNNATDDDAAVGTGTGNGDDEDNFTFPALTAGKNSYTIPLGNITVTNSTTQSATLHAWIDFDNNGKFDPTEHTSVPVAQGINNSPLTTNLTWSGITVGATGNTYARFRLTSDSSITNTTPGGAASNGEVEDYQIAIAIASDPKLLLVKRITAINPGKPDEIQFNNFVNDSTPNDNEPNWPDSDSNPSNNINDFLRGAISVPQIKPGDEIEYTIYFLSNGDVDAKNVQICDVVPDNMTFNKNSYGTEVGIGLALNETTLPTSINTYLSNFINDEPINKPEGNFYPPGTNPSVINLCKKHDPNNPNTLIPVDSSNNLSGAVLINLSTPIPPATGSGTPTDSYGFVRFKAKVK